MHAILLYYYITITVDIKSTQKKQLYVLLPEIFDHSDKSVWFC